MSNVPVHVLLTECSRKSFWRLFINYFGKLISFANDSILWFFSSELSDSKSFVSNNSKRKKRVTFNATNNTFIWSFGDWHGSTNHVKGKPLECLAVKDPQVGAFVRRHILTLVFVIVRVEKKCFQKGNI